MHGLGNDFMIVNTTKQKIVFLPEKIRSLSDRNKGIGFDQLLIIKPSYDPRLDFHYCIFNADGTKSEQCGNGARCIAHFLFTKKLINKNNIRISTQNRHIELKIINDKLVNVNMGEPNFNPKYIPFLTDHIQKQYSLKIEEQNILCGVVSMGNPHCTIIVKDIKTDLINTLGPKIEKHECFPERVNVGFMQIINNKHIYLRVYERGAKETQACGSGACAAVAIGIKQGFLSKNVRVDLPGGRLLISWLGPGYPMFMIGPSIHVYDGFIFL